ncbi:MAG: RluA family pseudouridine synthase [bacterium]|nr:RluA family pseudouridine synthase [bacterium]
MADVSETLESKFALIPEILYEDENILAVNKPAGLLVHPDGKNTESTLCDWLLKKYPEIEGVGEPLKLQDGRAVARPGIVHRLDRWTSGVLLVAKNQNAHEHLKKQFLNREVKKTYVAFVYDKIRDDFGTINLPIGRSKGDFRQYTAPPKARGEMREAVTYYEVIKRSENFTYLKAMPKTGRTHQIRVHLKAIGHPVVGDKVYALARVKKGDELGFERLALHAQLITFKNLDGKETTVEAPLPADFLEALKQF